MLKKRIAPLNIREMEDGEISYKKEKALKALILFWEEHGSLLLNYASFNCIDEYYDIAQEQLAWLEEVNA